MRITQVKIVPLDEGKLMGYADITIDNCFRVKDLKIFRQATGYYVAMPQVKGKDGKYRQIVFAINAKTRTMIEEAVIAEYEKVAGKRTR
jgi:stage V sporulation protein G